MFSGGRFVAQATRVKDSINNGIRIFNSQKSEDTTKKGFGRIFGKAWTDMRPEVLALRRVSVQRTAQRRAQKKSPYKSIVAKKAAKMTKLFYFSVFSLLEFRPYIIALYIFLTFFIEILSRVEGYKKEGYNTIYMEEII